MPKAEITQADPAGFVADQPAIPAAGEPAALSTAEDTYIEIHSRGYSRFEIGDEGHILVVYSGGVEFSYLGYRLRANELRFDQASRSANVSGDVRFESSQFVLSTQKITLDGMTGRGEISGHIVGSLPQSGIRFEANSAQLTFPPESKAPRAEETRLVLSGDVAVYSRDGATLRTDEVALDGATRRFSSAPFTLALGFEAQKGQPLQPVQITGTAFGGTLTEKGELARLDVLGLLAVSRMGRISAAQAVAQPDPTTQSWKIAVSGSPVRIEYSVPLMIKLQKQKRDVGPVLMEAPVANLEVDRAGLKSAALAGGVTVAAAGNRLTAGSVSVDRRAGGLAMSVGGLSIGLDLARLTGIEPVDLSELIK